MSNPPRAAQDTPPAEPPDGSGGGPDLQQVGLRLPRLYPILDAETLAHAGLSLERAACDLYEAGVRWLQYRDKPASDDVFLQRMRLLRRIFPTGDSILIVNDRVQLCPLAHADGVHIGQDDIAPADARRIVGDRGLLGISTHNPEQLQRAAATGTADYLAIGPVFGTRSKRNPDPAIGLEGVRESRRQVSLPLVAIGGITESLAPSVIDAGADSVAVISALLPNGARGIVETVRDFLSRLR